MSLAHHWRSQQFKPSRRDLLLAALTVLVSVSVLARAIVSDEPLAALLIPGAVLGATGYLTLVGLFGMGLGAILRSTAAGVATFAGIMYVLPLLVEILPSSVANSINPYLPSSAGRAMMQIGHHAHTLSPGAGLAVLGGYTAAALAAAAVLLVTRDV